MPRTCTICSHPDREDIERSLLAGEPFRHLAARTGTSTAALQRHKRGHLAKSVMKAHEAEVVLRADNLLDHVEKLTQRNEQLYREAVSILRDARRSNDRRTAVAAIGQANRVLSEGRATAQFLLEVKQQHQPTPIPRGLIDPRMIHVMPKSVESHKIIQLDSEEFPELDEEVVGPYREARPEELALLGLTETPEVAGGVAGSG